MKIFILLSVFFSVTLSSYSQQIIDNGIIYKSNADYKDNSDFVLMNSQWDKKDLTYYLSTVSNELSYSETLSAIEAAFSLWANISSFSFSLTTSEENADILIYWGTGEHGCSSPFDNNAGVLAHTLCPSGITNAQREIHFNDAYYWHVNGNSYDVETTAIHEIGHALGLDHSLESFTAMQPIYYFNRHVYPDDCEGIWAMYGFPFWISGPSVLCGVGTYTTNKVPVEYTVSWNMVNSNGTSLMASHILPDSTNKDRCFIDNTDEITMDNDTLIATIMRSNNPIASCKKTISANLSFYGSYAQTASPFIINKYHYPIIPETPYDFSSNSALQFNTECQITLKCPRFKNMTITRQGSNLVSVSRIDDETVRLYSGRPNQNVINVTINVTGGSGCNDLSFVVYFHRNPIPVRNNLSISKDNSTLTVNILQEGTLMEEVSSESAVISQEIWDVNIVHVATGNIVYSKNSSARTIVVSTEKWPKGIYTISVRKDGLTPIHKSILIY